MRVCVAISGEFHSPRVGGQRGKPWVNFNVSSIFNERVFVMTEKFTIPGFRLDLTTKQQVFAKTVAANGFRFEMRGGSAKTVRVEKERKYGYINGDVTKYGGVVGFTFPPAYIDASPYETENETLQWFASQYPGSKAKIAFHSIPSRRQHYLIILDVQLALNVCGL
jgi:hypothetical protein